MSDAAWLSLFVIFVGTICPVHGGLVVASRAHRGLASQGSVVLVVEPVVMVVVVVEALMTVVVVVVVTGVIPGKVTNIGVGASPPETPQQNTDPAGVKKQKSAPRATAAPSPRDGKPNGVPSESPKTMLPVVVSAHV